MRCPYLSVMPSDKWQRSIRVKGLSVSLKVIVQPEIKLPSAFT